MVDRMDESAAQKLTPDAIDDSSGEVRILRTGDPLGDLVLSRELRCRRDFVRGEFDLLEALGKSWLLEFLTKQKLRLHRLAFLPGLLFGGGTGEEDIACAFLANREPGQVFFFGHVDDSSRATNAAMP